MYKEFFEWLRYLMMIFEFRMLNICTYLAAAAAYANMQNDSSKKEKSWCCCCWWCRRLCCCCCCCCCANANKVAEMWKKWNGIKIKWTVYYNTQKQWTRIRAESQLQWIKRSPSARICTQTHCQTIDGIVCSTDNTIYQFIFQITFSYFIKFIICETIKICTHRKVKRRQRGKTAQP